MSESKCDFESESMTAKEFNELYPTGARGETLSLNIWSPCRTVTTAFTLWPNRPTVAVCLVASSGQAIVLRDISLLHNLESALADVVPVWEHKQLMQKWGTGMLSVRSILERQKDAEAAGAENEQMEAAQASEGDDS